MNERPVPLHEAPVERVLEIRLADGSSLRLSHRDAPHLDAPGHGRLARGLAAAARAMNADARPRLAGPRRLGMVCADARMHAELDRLERVAPTDANVLITGESGTGKELAARAVHERSTRAERPFVAINCSALTDSLLESALFGHRRGSFTGASEDRRGVFEAAEGGTLFLDEVGDMSPMLQVRLLRAVQERQVTPVGDTQSTPVDVRIVAATHRDLEQAVRDGSFREDLYYRLHVVSLHLPPLRERSDLLSLVDHFADELNQRFAADKVLRDDTRAALRAHTWPGNVRELFNELERLWVLSGDDMCVGPDQLRDHVRAGGVGARESAAPVSACVDLCTALQDAEREVIRRALRHAGGNRTHTAVALGISRRNLLRKIRALEL